MDLLKLFRRNKKESKIGYDIHRDTEGNVFCDGEPMEIFWNNKIKKSLVFGGVDVLNNNKPKFWYIVPADWDKSSLPMQ